MTSQPEHMLTFQSVKRTFRFITAGALGLAMSAGLISPGHVNAADLPPPIEYNMATESGFEVNIVPLYLWVPGMNGTVGVLGQSVDIDLTPIDILSNLGEFLDVLDGLYMGSGEIRHGDFGFVYDVFYLDVSSTTEFGGVLVNAVDVAFSQVMATLLASYRVMESETVHVDLLGGARINDIRMDIDVDLIVGDFELSDGATWVDPVFGAKGRMELSPNWYANGTALIGGFGVSSDFVWDVSANIGYQWNSWLDLYAGFRGTGTDYKSGSFIWDVTQYGPVMGGVIKLN